MAAVEPSSSTASTAPRRFLQLPEVVEMAQVGGEVLSQPPLGRPGKDQGRAGTELPRRDHRGEAVEVSVDVGGDEAQAANCTRFDGMGKGERAGRELSLPAVQSACYFLMKDALTVHLPVIGPVV